MSECDSSGSEKNSPIVAIEADEHNPTLNGLRLDGSPFRLEKIDDYEPGGHHPVHPGDLLGENSRYRVIHKLGNGGFANVWLCRDLQADASIYVAIKISIAASAGNDSREVLVADAFKDVDLNQETGGRYISLPRDHFRIDGPNGSQICFVLPVLGPCVSRILNTSIDPDRLLRKIAFQATQAMATFNNNGLCHGGECFSSPNEIQANSVLLICHQISHYPTSTYESLISMDLRKHKSSRHLGNQKQSKL